MFLEGDSLGCRVGDRLSVYFMEALPISAVARGKAVVLSLVIVC